MVLVHILKLSLKIMVFSFLLVKRPWLHRVFCIKLSLLLSDYFNRHLLLFPPYLTNIRYNNSNLNQRFLLKIMQIVFSECLVCLYSIKISLVLYYLWYWSSISKDLDTDSIEYLFHLEFIKFTLFFRFIAHLKLYNAQRNG